MLGNEQSATERRYIVIERWWELIEAIAHLLRIRRGALRRHILSRKFGAGSNVMAAMASRRGWPL